MNNELNKTNQLIQILLTVNGAESENQARELINKLLNIKS